MPGIKATLVFLMGSLAGFGVALLLYFARVLESILPGLYPGGPIDAFVAGVVLIAIGFGIPQSSDQKLGLRPKRLIDRALHQFFYA